MIYAHRNMGSHYIWPYLHLANAKCKLSTHIKPIHVRISIDHDMKELLLKLFLVWNYLFSEFWVVHVCSGFITAMWKCRLRGESVFILKYFVFNGVENILKSNKRCCKFVLNLKVNDKVTNPRRNFQIKQHFITAIMNPYKGGKTSNDHIQLN